MERTNFSEFVSSFRYSSDSQSKTPASSLLPAKSKRKREDVTGDSSEGSTPSKRPKVAVLDLPPLQDRLAKNLDVIICGCNPGYTSALVGFHYGMTPELLSPDSGPLLPELYSIGLTDLVVRPSHSFSDIPSKERGQSVIALLQRIAFYRPRILALNSFAVWSDIASQLEKRGSLPGVALKIPVGSRRHPLRLPARGANRQPCFLPWKIVYKNASSETDVRETLIIPMPGTSGANASYSLSEKVAFFKFIHDSLASIKAGTHDSSDMGQINIFNAEEISPNISQHKD